MADVYFRPDGQNRFQIRSAANGTLPSAWLDQEYNRIYTYLNGIQTSGGTVSGSEWATVDVEGTQVSTSSFSVEGDYTGAFEQGRAIRLTDDSDVQAYSHIKSATYIAGTNTTTVVLYDAIVPETIKAIDVGLIGKDAQPIPSMNYTTRTSQYTVGASDQIIFVNDGNIGSLTQVWDDEQVNGTSYYALLINLPVAGAVPGKLLCVKKIAGTYQTIVSSGFTHTTETVGADTVHHNTYTFQIYGDTAVKNRVTLKGVGDCYWLFSNGSNWYELTPEASETVKGVVRFATSEEMTLTAQQIADGETLRKDLAVSPYQADQQFLRTDASNLHFASNFIYQAPNGVAALVNNNIVIYSGLGLNIPDGRDANGVIKVKQVELDANITYAPVEVTENRKLMFITSSKSVQPVLEKNYHVGYEQPIVQNTVTGDAIIWFDYGANLLKLSTDNGTNWTTFDGCGPICWYYGNGSYTTNIQVYAAVGFLTRDDNRNILQRSAGFIDTASAISVSTNYTAIVNGTILAKRNYGQDGGNPRDHIMRIYLDGVEVGAAGTTARDGRDGYWGATLQTRIKAGQVLTAVHFSSLVFCPDL